MKKLYKFYWDYGPGGYLDGIFVADDGALANAIGARADFGEALGRHSRVSGKLEAADFTEVSDDQEFIQKFEELNCETGYNPLRHI